MHLVAAQGISESPNPDVLMFVMTLAVLAGCTPATATPPVEPPPVPIASGATSAIGQAAPDFSLPGLDGTVHTLSAHAGQVVVLEWFNPGCPFVKAAYKDAVVPALQAKHPDAVWLRINSGADGKQGTGVDTNQRAANKWDIETPVLMDGSGAVGQAYGAKTTPQLVVIDATGVVRFNGALDNAPLGDGNDPYVPYADNALVAVQAGQDVADASPKPWGCSVKY